MLKDALRNLFINILKSLEHSTQKIDVGHLFIALAIVYLAETIADKERKK